MSQPGELLAERWRLVEKIDAGAMGEIFRGAHDLLGHAVAIKVLMPEIARDKGAVERFLREARIAAKLSSPHVVRVEDYGVSQDGRPFLVMELLHGESLARRMERAEEVSLDETREIVRQIAVGLDAAHAAGIVHRDLKPENVFLVRAPEGALLVKVLDFGVAKFTDKLAGGASATASNTLVGTPRYMSPEQARSSRELDGRSDLWALGMLTYELLVGRHPFEGEAIAELLVAILTHRIAAPTTINPDLPEEVDEFMTRALARNRTERFSSGQAFSDALIEALRGVRPVRGRSGRARVGTPKVTRGLPPPEARRERRPTPTPTAIVVPPLSRASLRTPLPAIPEALLVGADAPSEPESVSAEETGPVGVSVETLRSDRPLREEGSRRGALWALMGAALVALVLVLSTRHPGTQATGAVVSVRRVHATSRAPSVEPTTPAQGPSPEAPAAVPETLPVRVPAATGEAPQGVVPRVQRRLPVVPEHRRREHPHATPLGEYDPATI